jgi:hypothetical protein
MKKQSKPAPSKRDGHAEQKPLASSATLEASFAEIVDLIQQARQRSLQAVNTELIDLYWQVGGYISRKLETATWGGALLIS